MESFEEKFAELDREMADLRFEKFLAEDAYALGMLMIEKAKESDLEMAMQIIVNGKKMFWYAFDGTDMNNERAVIRKTNVTEAFRCPSLRIFYELQQSGMKIADRGRDPMEYLAVGGAVPIYVNQVGVIGTVCVSGTSRCMTHFDDHAFTVNCLKQYLARK